MACCSICQPVVLTQEAARRMAEIIDRKKREKVPKGIRLVRSPDGKGWLVERDGKASDPAGGGLTEYHVDLSLNVMASFTVTAQSGQNAADAVLATWEYERPESIEVFIDSGWAEAFGPGDNAYHCSGSVDLPIGASEYGTRYELRLKRAEGH